MKLKSLFWTTLQLLLLEWSEAIRHVLPEDRLQLTIKPIDETRDYYLVGS